MSTALMAPKKKRNTKGAAIAQAILEQYRPQTKEDMQEAIKDIFGPMFEAMLQGEMDSHLGYKANDHGHKDTDNRRNGYISKNVKTAYGEILLSGKLNDAPSGRLFRADFRTLQMCQSL